MRRSNALPLLLILVLFVGTACDTSQRNETEQHLRVGMSSASTTLSPGFGVGVADYTIDGAIYDNLVFQRHDLTLEPMLAESWEHNDDLSEYTFHLRDDVSFHHGKRLTSDDVVFSIKRLIDPNNPSSARSTLAFISDVVAIDESTVRFDLDSPNAFLPEALTIYQARILPSDIEPDRFVNEAIGTGPFKLVEHVPDEYTVLEANDAYWRPGLPKIDRLTFFYMPEAATRIAALKSGEVDVIWELEAQSVSEVANGPETRVSVAPSATYLGMVMDTTVAPFDDVRVRRAFQLAADRQAINEAALFGDGEIANDHPIPPFSPYWDTSQKLIERDVSQAIQLLNDAGYPDGIEVTLHTAAGGTDMQAMAVAFKEQALEANIVVNVATYPEGDYWSNVWMQQPFFTTRWNGRHPDQAFAIVYASDATWNEAHYQNGRLDEDILGARAAPDLDTQKVLYGDAQRILIEDVPTIVPVFRPIWVGLRKAVLGVEAHPSNWLVLTEAALTEGG